jgi:DNA primase
MSRFPESFLEELRARLPVSEVVGRRVQLKKSGREWRGLSPFNKERTPSFFVNDQKGFWHDFSSGRHGDIFEFLMATEGVTFPEAVEQFAAMAAVPIPKITRESEADAKHRLALHQIVELAAKYFEATLAGPAGAKAREYLAARAIDAAAITRFRIGYALAERFALKEHLGGLGVSSADMIEAGLLVSADDIPVPFDRFRDRLMFPIADLAGRIVGFGGRALDPDATAKYLNSPETPLFQKRSLLYNGRAARQAAHDGAPLIVVEGYIDVIALVRASYPATVAPLGTALTDAQLAMLWRMADIPTILFDGDDAGRRAADRAIDLALPHLVPGKSLRFAVLGEDRDPDDVVSTEGAGAIDEPIATATPLVDMLWHRELDAADTATPDGRAALDARLNALVAGIKHETVRWHYAQALRARMAALVARPAEGVIEVAELGDSLGLAIVFGATDAVEVARGTGLGTWHVPSHASAVDVADAIPHFVDAITLYAAPGDRLAAGIGRVLAARGFEVRLA